MKPWMTKTLMAVAVLAILGVGGAWYLNRDSGDAPALRTAPVTRGDLLATIGATGTVEPEELIDVGAQVAGQILRFGPDEKGKPIDYGSTIAEGMVLAQIDDSVYLAEVTQAQAQLDSAKAGVKRAEADLLDEAGGAG